MRGELPRPDETSRAVFDRLRLPATRTTWVVVVMVVLDAIWWTLMYTGFVPMPGMAWLMDQGIPMIAPGAMERATIRIGTLGAVASYLGMWGVMMWAMMYPAMTRFTREYADAHRGSASVVAAVVAAFLVGYSVVWALSGVIPLVVDLVLPGGIYGVTQSHPHPAIGGVLMAAGFYQLSGLKRSLLQTCCSCVEPHTEGIPEAIRRGVTHGVYCILVSFGIFFLLMPFFGSMNLFWMVALATVVIVERIPVPWGTEFAVGSGVVAVIAGLIVLVIQPPLPVVFAM